MLTRAALGVAAALTAVAVFFGVHVTDRHIAAGLQPAADGGFSRGLGPVPSDVGAPLTVDFSSLPDGPIPAKVDGHAFRAAAITSAAMPILAAGRLVHGRSSTDNFAGYVETLLRSPVQRLGATVRFVDGGGSIALTIWQNSLVDSLVGNHGMPNAGVQFIVSVDHWQLAVWDTVAGHNIVLADEPYAAKPFGTPVSFEITRKGDTVTVHLPGGAQRMVTDPRITSWSGMSACWELYEFHADQEPAAITALWAG
ncbi:MAG: hypothetical protein JWN03_8427 [Nocardia sp.]|uniref:hypothetical protein n=1 Tax=Nocardia sp. TaxID=1821 RepID=UPI00261C7579|nr:hypothetical protein [Nocardia sp.]MCU1648152.1 hypothetical protein [Nocardia sp.]